MCVHKLKDYVNYLDITKYKKKKCNLNKIENEK